MSLILYPRLRRFSMALRALLREFSRHRRNRYHPERHYMRGPGPKSRSKTTTSAQ
ncbi:hypothetical protein DFP91_4306 [Pseudorhodoplanes sinuspersici]|nr:hypothetical protein DFP91_4306 [Pseudorhodoplanes sinuspersici]